jgi:hypothetical protein
MNTMNTSLDFNQIGFNKSLYTNDDLMTLMGCSEKTLRKYRDDGLLPFSSWEGRKIYYTPNDIILFLENTSCDLS